jgi:hypothetical protein
MNCAVAALAIHALVLGCALAEDGAPKPLSFRADIAPLLHRRCATCHNEESAKGGYRLDTFERLQKPGDSELPPLVAGKPQESELYRLLIEASAADRMPQKADALPAEEIALIERWIADGASFDGGAPERPLVEMAREGFLRPAPARYARPAPVTALAWSPDGSQLAVSGYFEVTLWRVPEGTLIRRIGGMPERIMALAWHPKKNVLAVAGGSPGQWGAVLLADPQGDAPPRVLCDLPETALSVAFSPDGARLAAGCGDRTVRLFDVASGKEKRVLRHHADWVQTVAFNRDGTRLLSASRDRTVRVLDGASGELEATFTGHDTGVLGAAFAPSGAGALSIGRGGKAALLWSSDTGEGNSKPLVLDAEAQILASGPMGVVTAGADRCLRVHQYSDRAELFTLVGHRDLIGALALGPRGEIASGSHDGEVCVWNLACGTWTSRFLAKP